MQVVGWIFAKINKEKDLRKEFLHFYINGLGALVFIILYVMKFRSEMIVTFLESIYTYSTLL